MSSTVGKLIGSVVDSTMLCISQINQGIIASPGIRMDYAVRGNSATRSRLQRGFRAIRNDLSVDFASSLQDAKHWSSS